MLINICKLPHDIAVYLSKSLRNHEGITTYVFDDNALNRHFINTINRAYKLNSIN